MENTNKKPDDIPVEDTKASMEEADTEEDFRRRVSRDIADIDVPTFFQENFETNDTDTDAVNDTDGSREPTNCFAPPIVSTKARSLGRKAIRKNLPILLRLKAWAYYSLPHIAFGTALVSLIAAMIFFTLTPKILLGEGILFLILGMAMLSIVAFSITLIVHRHAMNSSYEGNLFLKEAVMLTLRKKNKHNKLENIHEEDNKRFSSWIDSVNDWLNDQPNHHRRNRAIDWFDYFCYDFDEYLTKVHDKEKRRGNCLF